MVITQWPHPVHSLQEMSNCNAARNAKAHMYIVVLVLASSIQKDWQKLEGSSFGGTLAQSADLRAKIQHVKPYKLPSPINMK